MRATLVRAWISVAALAAFFWLPAQAQDRGARSESVSFAPGKSSTTITGQITGYESVLYRIGAEGGQTMSIELESSNTATYFNVYEPGRGPGETALAASGTTGPLVPALNRFSTRLHTSGVYTVSVYMMRSAARRGEQARFTLGISIPPLAAADRLPPVQGDFADGLQGGPDYWQVQTASADGTLLLHAQPSIGAPVVTSVANRSILRNRGCRMIEGRRWCRVETLPAGRTAWVVGDFLREGSPPSPAAVDAKVPGTPFHATGDLPCARAAGQPMGRCRFGVVRTGNGSATVTVFWPDGGNRVVFFEAGGPAGFDRSQADGDIRMSVQHDGDLFRISIGQQRFEIVEAIVVGG